MTCWGARSGTGESGELPQPPPQSREVWGAPHSLQRDPGHFRNPGSTSRSPPSLFAETYGLGGEGSRSGAGWPPIPSRPDPPISAPDSGTPFPNPPQELGVPRAPSPRDSGIPAPTHPPDQSVRVLHSQNAAPPTPSPSAQQTKDPSSLLPRTLRLRAPTPRRDPPSGSPPGPPAAAGSTPPEPPVPGEAELTDQGPIPAPGVFLRLRLRRRGAEDGAGRAPGTGWTT